MKASMAGLNNGIENHLLDGVGFVESHAKIVLRIV
jgi:hypothetical protein